MATSLQWPPLFNGHLSSMATSLQWPPLFNGHLSSMATYLQWPPIFNGHVSSMATYLMATYLQWPPIFNGHLSSMATYLQWPPIFNGHLSSMATSHQRTPFFSPDFRVPLYTKYHWSNSVSTWWTKTWRVTVEWSVTFYWSGAWINCRVMRECSVYRPSLSEMTVFRVDLISFVNDAPYLPSTDWEHRSRSV